MSLLNLKKIKKPYRKKKDLMSIIREEKETVKLTINVPASLHCNFKTIATAERRQMSDIVIAQIIAYIKSRRS